MSTSGREATLQAALEQIRALLERHRVLEAWTHNQAVRQREVVEALVHRQNLAELRTRLRGLHPGDLAYVITALPADERAIVWAQLDADQASLVLPELSGGLREELVARMPEDVLRRACEAMDAADLAYVSDSIPTAILEQVYRQRDAGERSWIESVMAYPEGSVGRLMGQDYVVALDSQSVGDTIEQIRIRGELARHVDAVFVLDSRKQLRGVVPIRDLLLHDPLRPIVALVLEEPLTLSPVERAESAAEAFTRYRLVYAPVVDERGKLLGALSVDSVMDSVSARATKEIQMMGGVEALDAPYEQVPFWDMVRKRGGWLSALFLGEMLTATAMGYYEAEIAKAVVLALFVPLIISSGGNSGSQAASLIIRALALRELALRDWLRVFRRELLSGLTLGTALGSIGFFRIILWQWLGFTNYGSHVVRVGLTVWLSLIGVVSFGTLAGSMLPFLLRRLGFDPATSSAPFVATLVDVTGLVIYFQVAALLLHQALS